MSFEEKDLEAVPKTEPRSEDAALVPPPIRFAYADPPYIGQAKKHYSADPNCAEVDHEALIARLMEFDAWALSASSPSLQQILALCPAGARVAAWVKPFASFKKGVNPAYAWEPVIFFGARTWKARGGKGTLTARDWVSASITLKKGLSGAKPPAFCEWLFSLMGLRPTDQLHDLFPGTGIVTECWRNYQLQGSLASPLAPHSDEGSKS